MASEKNLNAVFTDIANSIRSKKGTTNTIQPINMASEIDSIETGSSEKSTIYKGLEAKGTNWSYAFYGDGSYKNISYYITEINESDIPPSSNVTNMYGMFRGCHNLTTVPLLDTSNVTNMGEMFKDCNKIETIPQLDTSNVTNMGNMFDNCQNLITIPQLDTSNVTYMYGMFMGCEKLTSVPQLDVSNATNMGNMFRFCRALKTIYMKNIKVNLDISYTALQHDALVELINNGLATITTTQTLTMGSSKLSLLSDSEKQVALDRGWTLA